MVINMGTVHQDVQQLRKGDGAAVSVHKVKKKQKTDILCLHEKSAIDAKAKILEPVTAT